MGVKIYGVDRVELNEQIYFWGFVIHSWSAGGMGREDEFALK